jgi:hypothetical protein
MKSRDGFVSNSSATCFVLDLAKPGVREFYDRCRETGIPTWPSGRCTALLTGSGIDSLLEEVTWYSKGEIQNVEPYSTIKGWTQNYNWEDLLLVISSDEGMGGFIDVPAGLPDGEIEFH